MRIPTPVISLLAGALALANAGAAFVPMSQPAPAGAPIADDLAPDGRFEPGLRESLAHAPSSVEVLIRFQGRAPDALPGIAVHYRFLSIPAVLATVAPDAVQTLERRADVVYVESAKRLQPALDSATRASLARDVFDPFYDDTTPPIYDTAGRVVDGRDVAIAVVDTGIDGTHPGLAGRVAANWIVTPAGVAPAGPFTAQDAHGTHVAGIAAGTGAGSYQQLTRGSAPGADLQGFAVAGSLVFAAVAFDWILAHGQAQDPPIRVVLNAWTCMSAACRVWDAMQLHNVLASELAAAGYVVVFAAGNDGGRGFASTTSAAGQNPTPGIVSVANYRDFDSGWRIACLHPTSSRGVATDPSTWPDIAAPGADSMSPHAVGASENTAVPLTGTNSYRLFHGTSAAAAHVGGIAALMLQADPDLSPTDVEYLLKQTATPLDCGDAHVRADPAHPWTVANFAEGHGLVDAYAAVRASMAFDGVPIERPPLDPLPPEWSWIRTGVDVASTQFLSAEERIVGTYPSGGLPQTRTIDSTPGIFETLPFAAPVNHSAATVDLWIGTDWETVALRLVSPRLVVELQRVAADGTTTPLVSQREQGWFVPTLAPVQRPFVLPFAAPVAFEQGDRLRLSVAVADPAVVGGAMTVPSMAILYMGAWHTPSRIGLGEAAPTPPGTPAHCIARHDCAAIGDDRRVEGIDCASAPFLIEWSGPPGSFAALTCSGTVHTCAVTGDVGGAWGTCSRVVPVEALPSNNKASTCSYWAPDGERVNGRGGCIALFPVEDED